jgi:hypothetical protein
MEGKEEKPVRKAAKALAKLQRYRDRHAPSAAEVAAADITRVARLFGLPQVEAREAAQRMQAAGITPQKAARLFAEAVGRPQ